MEGSHQIGANMSILLGAALVYLRFSMTKSGFPHDLVPEEEEVEEFQRLRQRLIRSVVSKADSQKSRLTMSTWLDTVSPHQGQQRGGDRNS